MGIKLIVSDVDGTLVDHTEEIPEDFISLVEQCRQRGIGFCLSTGRTLELARPIMEKLGIKSPCVIANGAGICQGDTYLLSSGLCAEPILEVIRRADRDGLTVTFTDETGERAIRSTDYVKEHQRFGGRFLTDLDLEQVDWKRHNFMKIMFMDENRTGAIGNYQKELLTYSDLYWVTTYSDMAVELGPLNCNKATGIRELARLLDLDMKEVMACGDFMNDLEMIRAAGVGVAVGNAIPEVKEAADYTARASYCYGVMEAIKTYCFEEESN